MHQIAFIMRAADKILSVVCYLHCIEMLVAWQLSQYILARVVFLSIAGAGVKKVAPRLRGQRIPPNPQLFDDTSMRPPTYGYPPAGE